MSRRLTRPLAACAAVLALGAATCAPAHAAGDPLLDEQWALSEPAATGATEAWTQSRGDGVVVAILDSGIQLDHPDLAGSLWRNPNEVPGNGVDDDRNGYVDDVFGANVMSFDGNVDDDEGHGTHVAGIVAARDGNGEGGAGIAPRARLMAVKVLDARRSGNSSLLERGIRYAVDSGARILNVSLNGDESSTDLDEALRYAGERGATVVASSGNNARNIDARPSYPASSTLPAVLSVTATEESGSLLSIANRGASSVDIAAPGAAILSTGRRSRYELRSGTSMAAPFIAGSLALLAAARPDLAQADLRAALLQSAARRSRLAGLLGSGALDVGAAMHRVLPGAMWRAAPARKRARRVRVRVRTRSRVRSDRASTVRWTVKGLERVRRWHVSLDGRRVRTLSAKRARRISKRVTSPGRHRWKVVGLDARGRRVAVAARSFRVVRSR